MRSTGILPTEFVWRWNKYVNIVTMRPRWDRTITMIQYVFYPGGRMCVCGISGGGSPLFVQGIVLHKDNSCLRLIFETGVNENRRSWNQHRTMNSPADLAMYVHIVRFSYVSMSAYWDLAVWLARKSFRWIFPAIDKLLLENELVYVIRKKVTNFFRILFFRS